MNTEVRTTSLLVPGTVTFVLDQVAEAPIGTPVTARFTVPVNPPVPLTDTVTVADPPRETDADVGWAVTTKSRFWTTRVADAVWLLPPDVAVIVSG